MKKIILFITVLTLVILAGGSHSDMGTMMLADNSQVINGESKVKLRFLSTLSIQINRRSRFDPLQQINRVCAD